MGRIIRFAALGLLVALLAPAVSAQALTYMVKPPGRPAVEDLNTCDNAQPALPAPITRAPNQAEVDALLARELWAQPFTVDQATLNAGCDGAFECVTALDFAAGFFNSADIEQFRWIPPSEGQDGRCAGQMTNKLIIFTVCAAP